MSTANAMRRQTREYKLHKKSYQMENQGMEIFIEIISRNSSSSSFIPLKTSQCDLR